MSNVWGGGRRRKGFFAARSGLAGVLVVLLAAVGAANLSSAGAAAQLSITTSPTLTPKFDPTITDYTARCGKSLKTYTLVTAKVKAPAGTRVSVGGGAPKAGNFSITFKRAWDQSFSFVVHSGSAPAATYYVRCLPTNVPPITAIRTGTPENDYFLLDGYRTRGAGAGPYATHYLEIVDTHGVPVWWTDTGTNGVASTYVLPDGRIAWMSKAYNGITSETYYGGHRNIVQVKVRRPADTHDFEPLPNGDWLVESYTKVSGVDLSSIGGSSNTCIVDSVVQEITPTGNSVWSWQASKHLSLTQINADLQHKVASSTCARPEDAWHLNSLQPLAGNDFLMSMRFLNAAFVIDHVTGNVVWKLGGSPIPQSLTMSGDLFNGFVGQHDARMWPDGTVSVFDNGTDGGGLVVHKARVVRYAIDTTTNTATLVEQIREPLITEAAFCCGSARWLPNGDWAVGYGYMGVNAVVTPSGARVLSLNINDPSKRSAAPNPGLFSFRMTPVPPNTLTVDQLRAGMDAMHTAAPSSPRAVASGSGAAKVSWVTPPRNATSPLTAYVITPYIGKTAQPSRSFDAASTSHVVTGLRKGATYQFAVTAKTALGNSTKSPKSNKVVIR